MRNRGWLIAGIAVVLPAAALCWIQYRSFDELEAKTQAVARDTLRRNLEQVRRELEARIEAIAADALSGVDEANASVKLAAARARQPHVDRAFFVSYCNCARKPAALVEPGGHAPESEACALLEAFQASRPVRGFEYFFYRPQGARCAGCHQKTWMEQRDSAVYVFRAIGGASQFAGIRIPTGPIARSLLPESVAALRQGGGGPHWKAALTEAPPEDGEQVAIHAGAMLPLWHLTAGYEGGGIHSLARAQQRRSLWLSTLLLAGLLAGIAFAMRAAAREAQLAELKSAFVSNISHEMRTPLAAIRAFAETLELGRIKDPARIRQYYTAIHDESLRLGELIDNVLDLASVEAARKQWNFEWTDPGRLVESVCESGRQRILADGFQMSVRVDRPLAPVRADARALATVLANLLGNAVKYSRDVRRIEVRVWQAGGFAFIAVADHGIGIAPADLRRIFEKFYRAGDPLVHEVKGAGLGLALAKEIVEAHGGFLDAESRPGDGSTFTVSLPLAASPVSPAEAAPLETAHR